jgi:hypothetical protein
MNTKNKKTLTDPFLIEARRLYSLGAAPHWLKSKSKAPVNPGWSGPVRDDWNTLQAQYCEGHGLGIRLGEASYLDGGYLGCIDQDIRSADPRYYKEAIAIIDKLFPGLRDTAPYVLTGRGFGSAHFYLITKVPIQSKNIGRSSEMVKVYSPSSPISGDQNRFVLGGKLTKSELNKGFRMKAAWECDFMSKGKQVVVPPTRHPDTNEQYRWKRRLE